MGSNDEFGPDTETIRAWLSKRATYAKDAAVTGSPRAATVATDPSPPATRHPGPAMTAPLGSRRLPATPAGRPDGVDAGRSVLDALGPDLRDVPAEPAPAAPPADTGSAVREATAPRPRPLPDTGPSAGPDAGVAVRASVMEIRAGRWTEPLDNVTVEQATTDVDFPPRAGVRRALSAVLLVVLAATAVAGYLAVREPSTATVGVAATLAVLTLVVWAVRAGCTTTQLSIRRGQLHVRRAGRAEVVDLAAGFTPIAVVGEPGRRGWRVLVERPGQPLLVITRAMVDPHWFSTALYRLRPDLRPARDAEPAADEPEQVSRAS